MKNVLIKWLIMCMVFCLCTTPVYANTKAKKAFSVKTSNQAIQRFDARNSKSVLVSAFVMFDKSNELQSGGFSEVYEVVIDTVGDESISNVITVYEIIDGGRTLALNYSAVVGFNNLFDDSVTNYTVSGYCEFYADGNAYAPGL